jgi:O-antigen/teichoic acid export membrane protein
MPEPVVGRLEPAGFALTLRGLVARFRGSSFLLNLLSLSGATIASRLIGLITLGYAARVLGPKGYGLAGYGMSVVAYAGILLSPGFLTWGTRAIARDRKRAGEAVAVVALTEVVLATLVYVGLIAFSLTRRDLPERIIVLVCGTALFSSALSVDWVFAGLERMRTPAALSVPGAILSTVGLLVLVQSPADVYTYPLIGIGSSLLMSATGYLLLVRSLKIGLVIPGFARFRRALLESLPLGIMVALSVVLHHANNLIIHAFLGSTALGRFLAAFRLLELITTIPGILASVFLPRLARVVVESPPEACREARLFAQVHMSTAFFIAAFLAVEAPSIITIVYGARYAGAVELLRVMSIAVIFNFAICGYTNCLIAFGHDQVMLLVVLTSAVVSVAGGLLLVPRIGVVGAALVVACIDLSGWLVSLPFYRRRIASLQLATWIWPGLGASGIVIICTLLQGGGAPLWVRVPIAAAAYVALQSRDLKRAFQ